MPKNSIRVRYSPTSDWIHSLMTKWQRKLGRNWHAEANIQSYVVLVPLRNGTFVPFVLFSLLIYSSLCFLFILLHCSLTVGIIFTKSRPSVLDLWKCMTIVFKKIPSMSLWENVKHPLEYHPVTFHTQSEAPSMTIRLSPSDSDEPSRSSFRASSRRALRGCCSCFPKGRTKKSSHGCPPAQTD